MKNNSLYALYIRSNPTLSDFLYVENKKKINWGENTCLRKDSSICFHILPVLVK